MTAATATTPTLRPARAGDLDLLVRHRRAMWEDMGQLARGTSDPSEANYRKWLAPLLASSEVVGWVAEADGKAVASGLLWFQKCQPRPRVPSGTIPYLLSLYVDRHVRRAGLARAITMKAIGAARAAGHPRMGLHASEEGRLLYTKLGFVPSPEMWLDLPPPMTP